MTSEEMINIFSDFRPNATFVAIEEYQNVYGEISNFGLTFHIDYLNALKKSKDIVVNYKADDFLNKEAKRQILSSLSNRIDAFEYPLEERDGPYIYFKDAEGRFIKGIKAHEETGDLYMFGFVISKRIIKPYEYRPSNRSALTITKDRIESLTPISKFRQFKLIPRSYKQIKIEKLVIK
jgi:hypothetical protein